MATACDILTAGPKLHRNRSLSDQIASPISDDVNPQDPIGLGVGQNLDATLGFPQGPCSSIGAIVTDPLLISHGGLFELLLSLTHRRNLWMCVNNRRNAIVVEVSVDPLHELDAHDSLLHGFVSQHRPTDDVANGKDSRHLGLVAPVDRDESPFVGLDAHILQTDVLTQRNSTGCQ